LGALLLPMPIVDLINIGLIAVVDLNCRLSNDLNKRYS
jgi:hypothetical protein